MQEIICAENSSKLSQFVSKKLPQLSYSALQKLFRKGDIRLNGKKLYEDSPVSSGDKITVYYKDIFTPKIVYEDKLIAVFDKPVKIASEGEGSFEEKVKAALGENYSVCHRLDTNTSGLIIFAKDNKTFEKVKDAFKNGEIEKHYLAAVAGRVEKPRELTHYLLKDAREAHVKIFASVVKNSEKIITKIIPIEYFEGGTLLDVELKTGKTHQIRAHLAFIGHPIIGDSKYGKNEINLRFKRKVQALCAYKIIFRTTDTVLAYLNGREVKIEKDFGL